MDASTDDTVADGQTDLLSEGTRKLAGSVTMRIKELEREKTRAHEVLTEVLEKVGTARERVQNVTHELSILRRIRKDLLGRLRPKSGKSRECRKHRKSTGGFYRDWLLRLFREQDRAMSLREIVELLRRSDWMGEDGAVYNSVRLTLARREEFVRVRWGQYTSREISERRGEAS